MAMLEVHDGRGRVEFVTISREAAATFGADPKCDIVLDDPRALPFHGRIRWRRGKFRVEAFPEARALDVSGKRVVATRFNQGDEVRIGSCRIFMINPEDGAIDVEKTRVQPRPATVAADREEARARPTAPPPPFTAGPSEVPPEPLRRMGWIKEMEVAPPSLEAPLAEEPRRRRRGSRSEGTGSGGLLPRSESGAVAAPRGLWRRALRAIAPDAPPGEERIATSPLVLGLIAALAFLTLSGVALWGIIARTTADRQFQQAKDSYEDGDYPTAMKRFDDFLRGQPKDARAGKARVLRALANVRQYASSAGPIWANALEAAREMVREVGREPAYRDYTAELAELVLRTAEGLADRARAAADAKALRQAREAVKLHAQLAGKPAEALLARSRVPAKLAEAEAAVVKSQARLAALGEMDRAIRGKSAAGVFAARDRLVDQYPDLGDDRDVVARMTRANDLIRQAVTFSASTRAAETTPRAEPLGPPTSLVLRSNPGRAAAKDGPIVFALADGYGYALDGDDGAPLWHVPLGLSSPFPPQPLPGGSPACLAFDARSDELLLLHARTGELVWRQATDEPVAAPPLVLGEQVLQATPSGKVLLIDLRSGELRGTLDLGRPLAQSPVADENGQFFYVPADRASLFVLRRDPPGCVAVAYLGQESGSIACPPARIGPYLIVAENHRPNEGRWTVFALEDEGAKPRKAQTVPIPGWTWGTPSASGAVVWSTPDRGAVAAFAIGPPEGDSAPLTPIARLSPEERPMGPAFGRARTDRELWVASGRTGRFDLNVERGELSATWTLNLAGPALAPIQLAGRRAVLTQQWTGGRGVALWGINPADGSVAWRAILGSAWPVEPAPAPDGDGLVTVGTDGRRIHLRRSQLAEGGFTESPLPKPVDPVLPGGPITRLDAGGLSILAATKDPTRILVREGDGPLRPVALPAATAAAPISWGEDLLVPSADGRVYLIDPRTGASRAEPFVPPFERARPSRWKTPVKLEGDAVALLDESGRLRRLSKTDDGGRRLEALGDPIDLGGAVVGEAASTGGAILVATADGKVRVLSARDLSPSGAYNLGARPVLGPVAVGEYAFVGDAAGQVLAFGPDGRRLWAIDLGESPPVFRPAIRDGSAWFLGRDGQLRGHSLSDGSAVDRVTLDEAPAGAPVAVGDGSAIPTARGTIRLRSPRS